MLEPYSSDGGCREFVVSDWGEESDRGSGGCDSVDGK